jgi:hypothetical protein
MSFTRGIIFVSKYLAIKLTLLSAMLALSGCTAGDSGSEMMKDSVLCFPKDAQRWIARSGNAIKVPSVSAEKATAKRNATVYVDRSGSMLGYIKGGTNLERPLQDLISNIPNVLNLANMDTKVRSFGTRISDELPSGGAELINGNEFTCDLEDRGGCDNSETRLDKVLDQVSSRKDDLAIIVSDLWFTSSEIQSTGISALQPALTNLLLNDKVIAVYGIDAPFSGKIFDLPRAGTGMLSAPYTGRHPLYMMVVGSKRAVLDFDSSFSKAGPKYLIDGMADGRVRRSLFSVDPGPLEYGQDNPLSASKHPRLRNENFSIPPGVSIQRFVMSQGLPQKPGTKIPALPQWTGPDMSVFLDDAVWTGPLATTTRIWTKTSEACSPQSWIEQSNRANSRIGWSKPNGIGQMTFSLDPNKFGSVLLNEGVYMIVGETRRLSVMQPNPRTEWMRGEWNLDPARAESMAGKTPQTFPTLNLSEFGRMMEAALASAVEQKNQPLVGFTVLVKVEN